MSHLLEVAYRVWTHSISIVSHCVTTFHCHPQLQKKSLSLSLSLSLIVFSDHHHPQSWPPFHKHHHPNQSMFCNDHNRQNQPLFLFHNHA